MRALRERDIEAELVKRVKALGGEVRKVKWIGRRGAPDRFVMLPPHQQTVAPFVVSVRWIPCSFWVELKRPGGAATFPANAHERKQNREHKRMRKMGQRVEVVDSFERIEDVLA